MSRAQPLSHTEQKPLKRWLGQQKSFGRAKAQGFDITWLRRRAIIGSSGAIAG